MKKLWLYIIVGLCLLSSCEKDEKSLVGWEKVSSSTMDNAAIHSLAFSGNYMFAVMYSYSKGNLYKSADNGKNWTAVDQIPYKVISVSVFGNYIFAGTSKGIYRSADNGVSWTAVNTGLPFSFAIQEYTSFISDASLFANCGGIIYYTINSGESWISVTENLGTSPVDAFAISDNYIIAATWRGIHRSADNGISWSAPNTENKSIETFAISSNNVVAGASNGFYYSSDNGENWTKAKVSDNYQSPWIECFVNSGKNIYAGAQANGMYYSSDNGMSWSKINDGFETNKRSISIYSLAINGNYIYAGSNGDGLWRRKI